ncbi:uncharacterized protein BCR38DRAFT_409146 [Pseudomassariella vexata]|uniref:BZIP domain-containing protein n=1 Tax=Pseudomassariella vexata TaxID=1141098 RepID=A0A1Y2E3K6_9PEZI|nr:uncharacterized protein BCR38DRAFT_409146 [Pseudomassariella vexata]ORY65455.1 hypothetical protein BCR38DRAFT_409146 [Pseudomassariella vexata]
MTKSSSPEACKSAKRKGTRSVSTLTPSQLARKRANDREAQRAIRARTKEHIENLERELDELRSRHNRDETVQDLMKRNKALEDELHRLRESVGIPSHGSSGMYHAPYHSPPSRGAPEVGSYEGMSHSSGDSWTPAVPCSVPSTVSSPSSSGATDEFGGSYYPTSAPATILDRSNMSSNMNSPTVSCINGKMNYDDIEPDIGCPQLNIVPIPSPYQQPQPWNVYPMYYQASPTL